MKLMRNMSTAALCAALIPLFYFSLVSHGLAQPCVPPPSGLVSWWPGDGHANDIHDGNSGTLRNGVTFAPGQVGQAFSLDGADDYVEIADSGNLDGASFSGLTIDAWVRPDKVDRLQAILSKYNTRIGPISHYLTIVKNGRLRVAVGQNLNHLAFKTSDNPVVQEGQLTHVAGTWDGSGFRLYVNGAEVPGQVTTIGSPFPMQDSGIRVNIGSFESEINGNRFGVFGGLIDEVEIYNRALSGTEITTIFNAGGTGKCKLPVILGVEVDLGSNVILISGKALGETAPTATLFVPTLGEVILNVLGFDPVTQEILAELPVGIENTPGTFRLTVSRLNPIGTDDFAVTIVPRKKAKKK